MAEVWPESLPCAFIRGSMQHQLGENLLRAKTDTGPGKQRPRATSAAQPLSGTQRMTTTQWAALVAFYRDTLLEGSLVFTFPVLGEASDPEVRFTAPPTRSDVAPGKWDVRLELEIMP